MKRQIITSIAVLAVAVTILACDKGSGKNEDKAAAVNTAIQVKAPEGAFAVDNVHSMVVFKIRHLGVGNVYGRFNGIGGYILLDEKNPGKSKVLLKIDVTSVDTNVKKRDDHLRSPDFFDAKKFPVATFTSTSVTAAGKDRYNLTGVFELHGVKKEIKTVISKIGQIDKDPYGLTRAGGETSLRIKRSDYGVTNIDKKMPGGIGDVAEVFIAIEGVRK